MKRSAPLALCDKNQTIAALDAERQRLKRLVKYMTDHDLMGQSLCAEWSHRDVLAHILGYELHILDFVKLALRIKDIDEINNAQSRYYRDASVKDILNDLDRGHHRVRRLIKLVPNTVYAKKWIPLANGKIAPAQLFGDLLIDRAVHYLDIANPLKGASTIDDMQTLNIALDFVFMSIDLLNKKIPAKYHGEYIHITTTNPVRRTIEWQIGGSILQDELTHDPAVSVTGSPNDLIFTITGRKTLITEPIEIRGDQALVKIIRKNLDANAFWN